jgi:hypothetical protein
MVHISPENSFLQNTWLKKKKKKERKKKIQASASDSSYLRG